VDGQIYVAGGRPPQGHDFAVYDPQQDSWTRLPDLPTARNHVAAAAIDGKIYVVGGRFGAGFRSEMTNALEVYDPQANVWTAKVPMPTVRGGLNAVAANGCLHVFGGEGANGMFAQHELYDPALDAWYSLDPMPIPVHGVTGAALIDDWIHLPGGGTAVGGSSGSTIHQVVKTQVVCGPASE
jgi:N-acetylneuraminic acid mutarotase